LKSSLRDLFEGKPTRTAGAKRRGTEAARQPISAGDLLGVRRLSRLGAMARISGRQDAHVMERHIRMVIDAVMRKLHVRQHGVQRPRGEGFG